jgi:hypothetical protein
MVSLPSRQVEEHGTKMCVMVCVVLMLLVPKLKPQKRAYMSYLLDLH